MKVLVQIVNAFVDGNSGGNPAGVVLNAVFFSREEKLKIAAKVGLSETAFVSDSTLADFKLEFFTPTKQIPHCGHATIATFSYLHQSGKILSPQTSKETIDGIREISMRGELAFMEQKAPTYTNILKWENEILASLHISKKHLMEGKTPVLVNTGNSFLIIPLLSKEVLRELMPEFEAIEAISKELGLIGFYPFSLETHYHQRDATTRMFAPLYGINEESATGMAAGPLTCYLHDVLGIKKDTYQIEQGYLMAPASPSLILVEVEKSQGVIKKVMVGGKGMVMQQRTIEV